MEGQTPGSEIASLPACCRTATETAKLVSSVNEKAVQPGVDEKLGAILPLDLSFTDETGATKTLRERITKPTIIAFVFYRCPVVCNLVQGSIAEAINKITLKPGQDYNVLSISIDELDDATTAGKKKNEFFNNLVGGKFPDSAWKFLFGSKENIKAVTEAAGFYFTRVDGSIVHPAALIFVSSEGKIVRYLHGTQFLPLNVTLALTEAAENRVGFSIKSVVTFCFSYDSAGKKYVLNIMRISGLAILLLVVTLLFFLFKSGKREEKK
ncbi:MAG: SCO family protein [Candidatus Riflebacteria bacterium]|nr:SCO family protein [Candidatus Riflebacteria bacterium]